MDIYHTCRIFDLEEESFFRNDDERGACFVTSFIWSVEAQTWLDIE